MDVRAQAGASVATDDSLPSRITQSDLNRTCIVITAIWPSRSATGQSGKSGRSTGRSALPPTPDVH